MKILLAVKLPTNDLGKATNAFGTKIIQGYDFKSLVQRKKLQTILDKLGATKAER